MDGVLVHSLLGALKPGRHPGRGPFRSHQRAGRELLRSQHRDPGRLSARHALRRSPRGPVARAVPPELRLLASDRRPRPRRRGRLLRPVRRAEDLRRDPQGIARNREHEQSIGPSGARSAVAWPRSAPARTPRTIASCFPAPRCVRCFPKARICRLNSAVRKSAKVLQKYYARPLRGTERQDRVEGSLGSMNFPPGSHAVRDMPCSQHVGREMVFRTRAYRKRIRDTPRPRTGSVLIGPRRTRIVS